MQELGVKVVLATHWANGSKGAEELAHEVVKMAEAPSTQKFIYEDADTLITKVEKIATQIYGAASVSIPAKIKQQLQKWQDNGYGHYPICVAKTQSSFSGDATLRGAPSGHVLNVREVRLNAGAQFIVMVCGDLMTMPGLPKIPSAEKIDVNEAGDVVGLF
jgi:formate--tetrahydrofolate ligase